METNENTTKEQSLLVENNSRLDKFYDLTFIYCDHLELIKKFELEHFNISDPENIKIIELHKIYIINKMMQKIIDFINE